MDMARYIKCSSDRNSLMDYIDENYNTEDNYEMLEDAWSKLFPSVSQDDDDPDEGMYANLSTSQLIKLKDYLDNSSGYASGGFSYEFNESEVNVLIEAMKNFSNPAFTKDREMSRIAKRILNKLTNE